MRRDLQAIAVAFVGVMLGACGGDDEPPQSTPDASAPAVAYLTPTEHLLRASMALRGIRPSIAELTAVEEDADALEEIVDGYLDSQEFGATIREMHSEQLLIGVDGVIYPAGFPAVGALAGMEVQRINQSVMEAPLRLVEHVVMEDRPYHEIVTADYTVADPIVSTVFGIPYDESGPEWQVTEYDDGRPEAGILSDSFLFTRHSSTLSNHNRGRAAQMARALLCYDFLSREVEIDATIDLADEEAVANAIRSNPVCASCHQTLDPLAAHFAGVFPLYVPADLTAYPFKVFDDRFEEVMRTAPDGYFGIRSHGLRDLGILMAEDPRFGLCTARRFYSYLAQVEPQTVPQDTVSRLYGVFVSSGMNAKELARAIVFSDAFRTAAPTDALDDAGAEALQGFMKVRPDQLARTVEDLTGYRWATSLDLNFGIGRVGRIDLMTDSFFGFEVLGGGTDSNSVTRPAYTQTSTGALVMRGLAAHAAPYLVEADFALTDASERRLLSRVEASTVDEASVRAQLAELELRFFAERHEPASPAVDAAWALWSGAYAGSRDTRRAWTVTLYALLQDARLTYY